MATFILVHGTYTESAHWPALIEGLTSAAKASDEGAHFEELKWGGENRASARQSAAFSIHSLVEDIHSRSGTEKIILVGHSHGGSAIAYFLKDYRATANKISGSVFLSTPFVTIRRRERALEVLSSTGFIVFLAVAYLLGLTRNYRTAHIGNYFQRAGEWINGLDYPLEFLASYGIHFYLGFAVLFLVATIFVLKVVKASEPNRLSEQIRRGETANIPDGHYLFLRCSGDEAAAALSAAQFISWLSVKVSHVLERAIGPIVNSRLRHVWILLISVLVFPFISMSLEILDGVTEFLKRPIADVTHLNLVAVFIGLLVASVALISVLFAFAAFLVIQLQAFTMWTFGWTKLSTGLLVELAIEPLPFGHHCLTHINWATDTCQLSGITHSWTYAHPEAVACITDWARQTLKGRHRP